MKFKSSLEGARSKKREHKRQMTHFYAVFEREREREKLRGAKINNRTKKFSLYKSAAVWEGGRASKDDNCGFFFCVQKRKTAKVCVCQKWGHKLSCEWEWNVINLSYSRQLSSLSHPWCPEWWRKVWMRSFSIKIMKKKFFLCVGENFLNFLTVEHPFFMWFKFNLYVIIFSIV